MDYKKLYFDIINDCYRGNDPIIIENLEKIKLLYLRCSKTVINDRNFSYAYVKGCINFLRYLKPEEKDLINEDFLSFFKTLDNETFDLIKFIIRPEKFITNEYSDSEFSKYLKKLISLNKGYNSVFKSDCVRLVNLNNAIIYYNQRCGNPYYIARVIELLFIYGLKFDNYEYLCNYLDDPTYYYDKILNHDLLTYREKNFNDIYYFSTLTIINENIPDLFSRNKIIIR